MVRNIETLESVNIYFKMSMLSCSQRRRQPLGKWGGGGGDLGDDVTVDDIIERF